MMTDTSNIYNDESLSPFSTLQPNGVIQPIDTQNSDTHDQSPPPAVINDSTKPRIYCLNTQRHTSSRPSASQDLVTLYSLTPLANAVARFDPVTGQKNPMRKSYQGHIKDLPGKNIIRPDSTIREMMRVPESEADTFVGPKNIRRLERDTLEGFGVMPGVIPDFDPSLLGLDDDLSDHYDRRDDEDSDAYNLARRKKKRKGEDTDIDGLSGTDERKKKRKKI